MRHRCCVSSSVTSRRSPSTIRSSSWALENADSSRVAPEWELAEEEGRDEGRGKGGRVGEMGSIGRGTRGVLRACFLDGCWQEGIKNYKETIINLLPTGCTNDFV